MLYREQGYLPEALINYLALLGWNLGTAQEIFTFDELVRVFSFDRVQHAGARFDWEKLNWINGEWIRAMDEGELAKRLQPFLPNLDEATIMRAVPALKTRMTKLADATEYLDYLWKEPEAQPLDAEQASRIQMALAALVDVAWEPEPIETALEAVVARTGLSKNKLYTPIRMALTGKKVSLPIHYTLALLPKEVALARLTRAAHS
jgi:glutamyl/glutaminyl-tRNA synthetase